MAAPQNFYHQIFNLHPLLPFSETSVLHRDGRWKPPADGRWKASPLALLHLCPQIWEQLKVGSALCLMSPLHPPTSGVETGDGQVVSGRVGEFPSVEVRPLRGAQVLQVLGRVCTKAQGWLTGRFPQSALPHSVPSVCSQLCPWSRMLLLPHHEDLPAPL